ncbi:MAG: DUF3352 domain-containing protein [Bacteroidota bacterium]
MNSLQEILKDKRSRLAIFIIACLVVLAVFLIFRFSAGSEQKTALNAIPSDAAMILEMKQAGELREELSVSSGVWRELMNFPLFADVDRELIFLDSLFAGNDCASGMLKDHPVYISFHLLKTGGAGILYLTALPGQCSASEAEAMVMKAAGEKAVISEIEFGGESFTEVSLPEENIKFYYIISKGVFISGFQPELIADAVKQQQSDASVPLDAGFAKVQSTAGKKVHANLYVNFNFFPELFALLAGKEKAVFISELSGFAGWTALDVSIKKDAVLLNGFAVADTGSGYLGLFSDQLPQAIEITSVIPSSAAAFLCYSFSDFDKWYKRYKAWLQKKGKLTAYNTELAKLNKEYDADVEKEITTWIGREMALVLTEPADTGFSENLFLVIKSDNIENVTKLLKPHSQSLEKKIEKPVKTTKTKKTKNKKSKDNTSDKKEETKTTEVTEIKDNVIYEYKIPGVFPALFGKMFSGIEGSYYAIEGNYVIFGNTLSGLKKFVKDYSEEKNLDNNNSYLAFSKNVSAESNLFLYCNIRKSLGVFMKYANNVISEYIGNNLSQFKNFDAFAFQLKTSGDMYYCNFCLKTNTVVISESDALWSVSLDSTVYGKPVIVQDTSGKAQNIVAFDNACNMYMISAEGGIKWKLKLKEKPLGNVEVIDCNKDGRLQYLFNTASYLYIVDCDGTLHKKFPVKLGEESSAPLTLADYSKNKDYRIIVPCSRKIYNYQKDGTATTGWNIVKTTSDIISKISYLKFNGADCYAVTDKSGNIYIFDRKGTDFITLKEQPISAPYSIFYVAAAAGKKNAGIVATDLKGNIILILSNGSIDKTAVPGLSAQHYFFYEDINNDRKKEYIFIDKSKLSVYDSENKLIGSFTFPADITTYPEYFEDIGTENYLGVYCSKTQKIYVINKEYSVKDGYPLSATTLFALGSLNNDDTYNLVVGNGSSIYNYSFE